VAGGGKFVACVGGADPKGDDLSGTEGADDVSVDGGTTIPGGGDATASGSSISSSGKSGSCSSRGGIGTLARPFGTTGFNGVSAADDAAPDETEGAAFAVATLATPIGLVGFFVPVDVGSFGGVLDDGALREAAPAAPDTFEGVALPSETPTGLELPVEAGPALLGPVWVAAPAGAAVLDLIVPVLDDAELAAITPVLTPALEAPRGTPAMVPVAPDEPPLPALALTAAVEPVRVALLPSTRAGSPDCAAANSTCGSSSSPDAITVGTRAESGRVSGTIDPDAAEGPESSGPKSSSAPCASKSSSDSIWSFDGGVGVDAEDDGAAFPANPIGSSTGSSAKGSKAGREAASIVFEPESRRSILNVSCNAAAELPRRWLTDQ
jgi:hypothetical protein